MYRLLHCTANYWALLGYIGGRGYRGYYGYCRAGVMGGVLGSNYIRTGGYSRVLMVRRVLRGTWGGTPLGALQVL